MQKNFKTEFEKWEEGAYIRNLKRMYKTTKSYCDPRKKVYNDYRHQRNTKWIYSHECKFVRNLTNRKFRRMLRREIYNEVYYRITPHDYKTYGWMTW